MNSDEYKNYGTLVLRVTLGTVLIAHSLYLKLVIFTLAGTASFFASIGLPSSLAYIVFAMEAVAGIALVVGYKSSWFALSVIPILIGASWAHWSNGWLFTASNGGWEYPVVLVFLSISVFLIGDHIDSVYSLSRKLKNMRHT